MIADGLGKTFGFDSQNRIASLAGAAMHFDALDRLSGAGTATAGILYETDGTDMVAERNPSTGAVLRRHVFGPGMDEPLVWYEGAGTANRRFLHADERGSIVAVTDGSGSSLATVRYDEYGSPQVASSVHTPRFLYTGQFYFTGPGVYHYKARLYHPKLGRFLQPDPIGYADGMNMYAYVGGDPVNFTDPTGLKKEPPEERKVCTGTRTRNCPEGGGISYGASPGSRLAFGGGTLGLSGQVYTCVRNCGAAEYIPGAGGDIGTFIIDGPVYAWISTGTHWYVKDGRFVFNPYYEKSEYSDAFDVGTGDLFAGPMAVIGGIEAGGAALALARFAKAGREIAIGKNWRFAPFGNRVGDNWFNRVPHYHRRSPGIPGQGIGRHRPWENKSSDTSFWHRF